VAAGRSSRGRNASPRQLLALLSFAHTGILPAPRSPGVAVRQSWLSPLAATRAAGAKGRGVFAVAAIPAGTTVAGFGGHVVSRAELDDLDHEVQIHALQIDDDLFLASSLSFDDADYVNHSCEPNAGLLGNVIVVAMTDIAPGEEICFDYAMCDSDDYDEFVCECRTPSCRGLVTGADWKRPELQARYAGSFSSYLEQRIAAEAERR
jgi:uncharacterized protein